MKHTRNPASLLAALLASSAGPALAQNEDLQNTWDLSEIYPSVEAWQAARDMTSWQRFEEIETRRGTLGVTAPTTCTTHWRWYPIRHARRPAFPHYANLKADENLQLNEPRERRQLSQIMFSRLNEATAWMQPEILRVGEEVINRLPERKTNASNDSASSSRTACAMRRIRWATRPKKRCRISPPRHSARQTTSIRLSPIRTFPGRPSRCRTGEEGVIDSQGYSRFRGSRESRRTASSSSIPSGTSGSSTAIP